MRPDRSRISNGYPDPSASEIKCGYWHRWLSTWDGSNRWILGHSSGPRFVAQSGVEGRQLQPIAPCEIDQVGVRDIFAGGDDGQRSSASSVPYESMPAHPQDRFERHNRVFE